MEGDRASWSLAIFALKLEGKISQILNDYYLLILFYMLIMLITLCSFVSSVKFTHSTLLSHFKGPSTGSTGSVSRLLMLTETVRSQVRLKGQSHVIF